MRFTDRFAPDNEQLLQHESKEFTLAKEGVNDLQLYSEQTDTLNVMCIVNRPIL